jgi:hypothetical protein
VLACGCSGNELSVAPTSTPTSPTPVAVVPPPLRDAGNWTPFYFSPWQPGLGSTLGFGATINAAVDVDELCVPDIYWQWGARACERYIIQVPSGGWLHGLLRWDASAPGFDPSLAGEVVLVASTGRFATSDWKRVETEVFALVEPGLYDILVLSYAQTTRLPFQLRAELRSQ